MKSEHVVMLALIGVIILIITRGAAGCHPPPNDTEPDDEREPEYAEPDLVLLPKEHLAS